MNSNGINRFKPNNFGALRLLFAYMVIISHSLLLIDNNYSREILTRLFGTMDIGAVAVDGFFLISGYLITQSFAQSPSIKGFLIKRILRIYPGFFIAAMTTVFIFTPWIHGWGSITKFLTISQVLSIPLQSLSLDLGGSWMASLPHLADTSTAWVNAPMWTIRYEFSCYLVVPILGVVGILNSKKYIILLTGFIFSIFLILVFAKTHWNWWQHEYFSSLRFLTVFITGSVYYCYKDCIVWSKKFSVLAILLLAFLFKYQLTAEPALILLGGYLMFNFALSFKSAWLQEVGRSNDISYGVYLYAWPFQALMVKQYAISNPWMLTFYTFIFASIMGFLSWRLVEKPFIQMKRLFN